jgi:hypothetical protein
VRKAPQTWTATEDSPAAPRRRIAAALDLDRPSLADFDYLYL